MPDWATTCAAGYTELNLHSILLTAPAESRDALIADLWEVGTVGIVEESDHLIRAFFENGSGAEQLAERYRMLLLEEREESSVIDHDISFRDWDPVLVGERFFVAPTWVDEPTPPGRVRLVIDYSDAFGSGRHETTQIVMSALEEYLEPGDLVLDIGCGSGILSAAALHLGAGSVVGCDIHLGAVKAAQHQVNDRSVFVGSADAIRSQIADVTLVNITAAIADSLAAELKRIAKPRSLLLVSGFLSDEPPARFHPERVLEKNSWLCWICRPEAIDAEQGGPVQPFAEQWW